MLFAISIHKFVLDAVYKEFSICNYITISTLCPEQMRLNLICHGPLGRDRFTREMLSTSTNTNSSGASPKKTGI